ncbi:MAG TPA: VIT domain-containing protein [Kofleriaceae bacterium]
MTRRNDGPDVLEQNVTTLLETGGEPPMISEGARARIRDELLVKHGRVATAKTRARVPLFAVGIGLAATAATALVVSQFVGDETTTVSGESNKLADGSTYVAKDGAKVTVLGPRRVRVDGAALLDVAPGKGTFVVETAAGRIEVLGTRFVVDAEQNKTLTAVVRGQVKLTTDKGSVVLHAGEQATAEPGRVPVRAPAPRLSHLVSWAQSARHREEHTVEPLRNGSLFARDPGMRPNGQFGDEYPLPLKQLTLDVVVENQVARVALDQTFHNAQPRVLEGVYKFAIPPDAALQRLAMYVDGKLTESAVVERMRARRIYEELVVRRIDPALLEYAGTGRLNLRVYPLPANQDKRLMLAYTQSVAKLYNDWTLSIPLPEVDQPVGEMLVSARIKGCANCELSSPSHKIDIERSGDDAVVKYKKAGDKIGDSFVVHVRDARRETAVTTAGEGNSKYMMVRAPVELGSAAREYRPRTWVILNDVSASRSAMELKAQADLVDAFLRELDEQDKVALVAFDVEARQKLAPTRVIDVDRRIVRQALKGEGGVGATDFNKALEAALRLVGNVNPDDAMIVYLGDGVITSGPRQLDVLRQQIAGKAHFVGVGVGDGPDTQTLGALAAATGGYSANIDLSDDVRWRAFDLIAALHTSRVTGVSAKLVDEAGQLVPSTTYLASPQLADGEQLELVTKLAGSGTPAAVELTGTRGGAPWKQTVKLGAPAATNAGYLPRLWAQQHIDARLLAKHDPVVAPPCTPQAVTRTAAAVTCPTDAELRNKRDEEIRQEVITLGKQYFLLSRHTSLLVLENDAMYAQYGVRKGAGDTWAPYALPATIPVVTTPMVGPVPSSVADDAELIRDPLQLFADNQYGGFDDSAEWNFNQQAPFTAGFGTVGTGRFGTIGHGSGTGSGFGRGGMRAREASVADQTRATLGLTVPAPSRNAWGGEDEDGDFGGAMAVSETRGGSWSPRFEGKMAKRADKAGPVMAKRAMVRTSELRGSGLLDMRNARWRRANVNRRVSYGAGPLSPVRLHYPNELAFDDVTGFIPALVPDATDEWREQLRDISGGATAFPIDDGAKRLLTDARRKLPAGIYRWNEMELIVDSARRLGWRRTTETGLAETASFDGTALVRRYAELGITATRPMTDDALVLSLAYLPVLIAEPEHYARWFEVKLRGPREVTLSTLAGGKTELALVLTFDDQSRLVSITDRDGKKQLEVTWSNQGPSNARVLGGDDITVGFTPDAVTPALTWVQSSVAPVVVDLPTRVPAYWHERVAKQQVGTPAWRHAQRQLMATAAAMQDRALLYRIYDALRENGGIELGDLALASGGIATATTDAQFAEALAPASITKTPLARYLVAGRAYGKAPKPARMTPESRDGLIGALWSLRSVQARTVAGEDKVAVDELLAMGDRAFMLRLVGAVTATRSYSVKPEQVVAAWDSVAIGPFKNLAKAQAVQMLASHSNYDVAAERFAKLANELDLGALPPAYNLSSYVFSYSRAGTAGYQMIYATLRDRVLAGDSFAHVMAFVPLSTQHPADLVGVLARAAELAGDDPERKLEVARLAIQSNQQVYAQTLIEPMLKTTPTRELYQMAGDMARAQNRTADALMYYEKAQEAGANEPVELPMVRSELANIIGLAQQLAMQSRGAERKQAVDRALAWAERWRMIDPGNESIDTQVGTLLLNTGDPAGAWRQLSSAIERDPWSSSGYITVANSFEQQGKVADALSLWEQAIVIDQTNPTPRLRKAQALIALGRTQEGDALLAQVANGKWHDVWSSVVYQAKNLIERGKKPTR